MQKIKQILISKSTLSFFIGGLLVFGLVKSFEEPGKKVSFLSSFELRQPSVDRVSVRGSYEDKGEINTINLECELATKKCVEQSFFILPQGVAGMGMLKEYTIIESTPSKIIATFEGLSAVHSFIIELDKNIVTFKNQSKDNPSDVRFYVLENGSDSIKKAIK